jgi:CRP-like cAMP-binding protein
VRGDRRRREARRLARRRITHDELAALVGSTRQWVTMMLKRFQREGIVSVDATHIRLVRPGRLQEIVLTEG